MGKIIFILSMFFCLNLRAQTDTTASILIIKNQDGKYEVTMRKGEEVDLDLVSYILAHFLKLEYDSIKPKGSEF
jgi:hypothetical protein